MPDIPLVVVVEWTCNLCGVKSRRLSIPARGTWSLQDWMEKVLQPRLGRDHRAVSPNCTSTNCDLKLPYFGGNVGDPPSH